MSIRRLPHHSQSVARCDSTTPRSLTVSQESQPSSLDCAGSLPRSFFLSRRVPPAASRLRPCAASRTVTTTLFLDAMLRSLDLTVGMDADMGNVREFEPETGDEIISPGRWMSMFKNESSASASRLPTPQRTRLLISSSYESALSDSAPAKKTIDANRRLGEAHSLMAFCPPCHLFSRTGGTSENSGRLRFLLCPNLVGSPSTRSVFE